MNPNLIEAINEHRTAEFDLYAAAGALEAADRAHAEAQVRLVEASERLSHEWDRFRESVMQAALSGGAQEPSPMVPVATEIDPSVPPKVGDFVEAMREFTDRTEIHVWTGTLIRIDHSDPKLAYCVTGSERAVWANAVRVLPSASMQNGGRDGDR